MKIFKTVLVLSIFSTFFTGSAFAGKCQPGGIDKINGSASGILGGTNLVQLADDTTIQFLSVPSGMYPNYEVAVVDSSQTLTLGSTTEFNECQRQNCKAGAIVTLSESANAIRGGTQLVQLSRGSQVQIVEVPRGMYVNYEVAEINRTRAVLLGASTQFKNCR